MQKEINDIEGMNKILNHLYGRLPVYIVDSGREYPIKVIALKEKGLIITHNRKINSDSRVLTITHNRTKFLTFFKYLGGDDKGIEILRPIKIILREATREGNRINLEGKDFRIKVVNTLNQSQIHKAQGFDDENVDRILTEITAKLKSKFDYASIYYSPRLDNRLRLMQNYDKSIFVPNRREEHSVTREYFPYEEYLRLIQVTKIDDRYVSEISIPIRYKGYTPLGYIQVMSQNPLAMDSYDAIKMVSETISREIINTGIFQESKEVCEVSDISSTGLSFLHSQSRFFARSFTLGEIIIFEIIFPNGSKATMRAMIKNIKNTEVMFRVGIEYYNLTLADYKILDEFLNSSDNIPDQSTDNEE